MKRKIKTMDAVLVTMAVFLLVFVVVMLWLYQATGGIPDTLCTCVFATCGGECGVMGWIRTTKDRQRERRYEVEDRREEQKHLESQACVEMDAERGIGMGTDVFLLGLLIVSMLTGLVTEAVKKILRELGKDPLPNLLAGIVAMVLAVAVSAGYFVLTDMVFTAKVVVYGIALVVLAWLAAMIGYDKVMQAIAQFMRYRKGDG